MSDEPNVQMLGETETYAIFVSQDAEGEQVYHIELGNVTLHLFLDEWEEFVDLMMQAMR
ncbi:MAG: hypothetical protein JXA21_25735 [Anaerolineae bacterium]|nr:hypothetical protein [Anaerolineae bacterium]